jgi:hypothetical protein
MTIFGNETILGIFTVPQRLNIFKDEPSGEIRNQNLIFKFSATNIC